MNIILGIISIILTFSTIVLIERLFKKDGLLIWISVATILANIIVCKAVNIFGFVSSLGNIMFASNFLATDILAEKYGTKYAKGAINCAVVFTIVFLVTTQISLLFIPDKADVAHDAMRVLFSLNLRSSIASLTLFYLSNKFDIYLYDKLRSIYPSKLWLRNNVSTIIANCCENYLFAILAFIGIYDIPTILSIATIGSVLEIIIALLDTPFLYLASKQQ